MREKDVKGRVYKILTEQVITRKSVDKENVESRELNVNVCEFLHNSQVYILCKEVGQAFV